MSRQHLRSKKPQPKNTKVETKPSPQRIKVRTARESEKSSGGKR